MKGQINKEIIFAPYSGAEGGETPLEITSSQMETIRYQFESYCKKIVREKYRDFVRKAKRLAEKEVTFSGLSQSESECLRGVDEYMIEQYYFAVGGDIIVIKNEQLYNALSKLPETKRNIILLSYYHGRNDVEIAKKLNMVRRTVQYQRTRTLVKLKKYMGGTKFEQE